MAMTVTAPSVRWTDIQEKRKPKPAETPIAFQTAS